MDIDKINRLKQSHNLYEVLGAGYYEEDSCTLCYPTNKEEQTENASGIGCKYNYRVLDKRKKLMEVK